MFWNIFFWVFGVATCAYYAGETVSSVYDIPYLCCFFAPLLFIPISNSIVLLTDGGKAERPDMLALVASMQAIAVALSTLLLIVLSPLVLLACMGLIFTLVDPKIFAMCMFYLCVATGPCIASHALYIRIMKRVPKGTKKPGFGRPTGLAVVLSIVLCALFPTILTRTAQKAAESPLTQQNALLLLRGVGDDSTLLRSCYSEFVSLPWYFQMLGSAINLSAESDEKYRAAREIFYRVKGRAFNSYARPHTEELANYYYAAGGPYGYWTGVFGSDRDFAGDTVGGIVRGLTLDRSKITGWVDADEALSHLTWKMHFKNDDSRSTELRGQILLPPHAVVTGCSLFVNGERHQAEIKERNASRVAYEVSAVKGERPLMVSTSGAGRVLVQSSMGTWGKEAELEVDIASPLVLTEKTRAVLPLPVFCERNFAIGTSHDVDLHSSMAPESSSAITCRPTGAASSDKYDISAHFPNNEIASSLGTISFARNPSALGFQSPVGSVNEKVVHESIVTERLNPSVPTVVVVDGSQSMASSIGAICRALDQAHQPDMSLVWASDRPTTLASHVDGRSAAWHKALERMRDSSCLGGQDNGAALEQAVKDLSGKGNCTNIVWLHATQPVDFNDVSLPGLIKDSAVTVRLFEYQVEPGPNVVIKSLDKVGSFEQVPRIKGLVEDVQTLLAKLAGDKETIKIVRSGLPQPGLPRSLHSNELAQLAVADEILAYLNTSKIDPRYGKMAQNIHVVTPLTSALVLDVSKSMEQYLVQNNAQYGPVTQQNQAMASLSSAPGMLGQIISTKPEPPMSLLMAIALLVMVPVLWLIRRTKGFA
jgi:hypothetical protein